MKTTTTRLTGYDAIEFARQYDRVLAKYTDPIEEAREGLTPNEAYEIAAEDPGLIYIDLSARDLARKDSDDEV